jgi:hypothetical protein
MTTSAPISVTGAWTLVYDAALSGAFTGLVSCLSSDQVIYRVDTVAPAADASGIIAGNPMPVSLAAPQRLYARAQDGAATVALDLSTGLFGLPAGLFEGLRAMTVQPYDEANKKLGVQWEASRLVTIANDAPANNVYSIIRTGSKPVDLKSRVLGYTGAGVVGRIYKNPVYTGGAADPWYNMNGRFAGTQPEAQLLVGFTLTSVGTKAGADLFAIGPASQQGKGALPQPLGSNRIFDEPNTAYLLEIASLDQQPQQVASRLEIYEGALDLPL